MGKLIRAALLLGDLRPQPQFAGKGELLRNGQLLLGHVPFIEGPGVHRQGQDVKGKIGVIQSPGGTDRLLGRGLDLGFFLDLGVGLQGFSDEGLQIGGQPGPALGPQGGGPGQQQHGAKQEDED